MGPENAEMSDIFISYASRDRPKAQVLAQALMQRGWSVWWDRTKAFLVNADLRLTNLEGADLWEADLRGADLRGRSSYWPTSIMPSWKAPTSREPTSARPEASRLLKSRPRGIGRSRSTAMKFSRSSDSRLTTTTASEQSSSNSKRNRKVQNHQTVTGVRRYAIGM